MKALQYQRSVARYVAANVASRLGGSGAGVGPVQLASIDPPELPGPGWRYVQPQLSGICGSDLGVVAGQSSRYFEDFLSFPFVLGHEITGVLEDGTRVVIEPALGCAVREIHPPCPACAKGNANLCRNFGFGAIEPGIQTGLCATVGGGWSELLVAHESQLHAVPTDFSDQAAVMVEPTACAVHAIGKADTAGAHVVVLGAGTLGLLVTAALSKLTEPASITTAAKHPHQRQLAKNLGATSVIAAANAVGAVRLATGSLMAGKQLTGGADVVFDCVGNADSLAQSLQMVRPGGRIVLVGMPGHTSVDLAPLWHREVELVGAYCYGTPASHTSGRRDFQVAFDLVRQADLGRLVSAHYPLSRFTDAIDHAANAGSRGAVKVVFDLRRNTNA